VLVVSHDRYFVDRVCDKVVALLGDGSLAELPGGVEEYLARRAAGGAPLTTAAGATTRPVGAPAAAAAGSVVSAVDSRAAKKEASRLERRMLKLDADEKRLLDQLAAAASDYAKAAELDSQLRTVQAEKDQAETDWLAAAEIAEG
jgi:ATP-binding cassette subfamily F protein uup